MLKKFIRSKFIQTIFAYIIAAYMVLVRATTRWEYIGLENVAPYREQNKGMIINYWHSRIIIAHSFWPTKDPQIVNMLISMSKDGEFVARAAEIIGRKVIRGSSAKRKGDVIDNKGALAAVRDMIAAAKSGNLAVITPDGPKGPRMRFQPGAIRIAKSAKAPMIPLALAVKGSTYLKSWDRFVVPPLFSKGVIMFGEPVFVEGNNEDAYETARLKIEDNLIKLQQKADELVGGIIVEPAAPIIHESEKV
jgi:lysophospholipid acyltransferase (LPLAT)-like uncharacterized protein